MFTTASSAVATLVPTASIDIRCAGWGAILAAIALILTPLVVFVGLLLGLQFRDGAAAYDPVTHASWTSGLFGLFGLLELVQAIGIAFPVVGVRRALPSGWARDLGALAGTLWVAGLTLHASAFMVQFTQAQADNWCIAQRLGLSGKTVSNNLSVIFTKLRVSTRTEAALLASANGLGKSAG